jgi:hypothetical protein
MGPLGQSGQFGLLPNLQNRQPCLSPGGLSPVRPSNRGGVSGGLVGRLGVIVPRAGVSGGYGAFRGCFGYCRGIARVGVGESPDYRGFGGFPIRSLGNPDGVSCPRESRARGNFYLPLWKGLGYLYCYTRSTVLRNCQGHTLHPSNIGDRGKLLPTASTRVWFTSPVTPSDSSNGTNLPVGRWLSVHRTGRTNSIVATVDNASSVICSCQKRLNRLPSYAE